MDLEDKNSARNKVLSYIIRNGGTSRKEIAEKIGVTRAALTYITTELITEGILFEVGELVDGSVGRRQVKIDINKNYKYALGFDVSNTVIRITIINLKAEIIDKKRWEFELLNEEILKEAIEYTHELIKKYNESNILGIGLLVQGYIENEICHSLPIKNLKHILTEEFNLKILMINNVQGIAITERYFGNTSTNFLLIKYGPGVGGVIVIDGKIVTGQNNRAGEIGHIRWGEREGAFCNVCGKEDCLESIINFKRVARLSDNDFNKPFLNFEDLLNSIKKDNGRTLDSAFFKLAKAVRILIEIINPNELLLAGEIFSNEYFFNRFKEILLKDKTIIDEKNIFAIENYAEKRTKLAGIVVLNEFFNDN